MYGGEIIKSYEIDNALLVYTVLLLLALTYIFSSYKPIIFNSLMLAVIDVAIVLLWFINPIRLRRAVQMKSRALSYIEFITGRTSRFYLAIILIIAFLASSLIRSSPIVVVFSSRNCSCCVEQINLFKDKFRELYVIERDIYSSSLYEDVLMEIYGTLSIQGYGVPLSIAIVDSRIVAVVGCIGHYSFWNRIFHDESISDSIFSTQEYRVLDKHVADRILYLSILVRAYDYVYLSVLALLLLLLASIVCVKVAPLNLQGLVNINLTLFTVFAIQFLVGYPLVNYVSLGVFTLFSIFLIVAASVYRLPVDGGGVLSFSYPFLLLFNYMLYTKHIDTWLLAPSTFLAVNVIWFTVKFLSEKVSQVNKILQVLEVVIGLTIADLALLVYY